MIFYFSGTGNSQWVAKSLSRLLNDENCVEIAEATRSERFVYSLQDGDRLGFMFPVYGWNVPKIVADFIKRMQLTDGDEPEYLYFVATCGDDTGRMLQEFRKLAKLRNWELKSAYAIQMPNTYVCLPGFDVDNKALEQLKLQKARQEIERIGEEIIKKRQGVFETRPGLFPRFKTYVLGSYFRHFLMTDKPFHVNDCCTKCGICVRVCLTKNIQLGNGGPHWEGHCTSCLACYHHCPQHAIQFGRQTSGKGQYLCTLNKLEHD